MKYHKEMSRVNTPLLLIAVACAPAFAAAAKPAPVVIDLDAQAPRQLKFEPLAVLKAGSGPGEVGIRRSSEGVVSGPRHLAVDAGGVIYVDDTLNRRLLKFSPEGRFESVVARYPSKTEVLDLFVRPSGLPIMTVRTKKGKKEAWIARGGRLRRLARSVPIVAPGAEQLTLKEPRIGRIELHGLAEIPQAYRFDAKGAALKLLRMTSQNIYLRVSRLSGEQTLAVVSRSSGKVASIPLPTTARGASVDAQGHLYVLCVQAEPANVLGQMQIVISKTSASQLR